MKIDLDKEIYISIEKNIDSSLEKMRLLLTLAILSIVSSLIHCQLVLPQLNIFNKTLAATHVEQFLNGNQLQQLEAELFLTVVTALEEDTNMVPFTESLKQVFVQYASQIDQLPIK